MSAGTEEAEIDSATTEDGSTAPADGTDAATADVRAADASTTDAASRSPAADGGSAAGRGTALDEAADSEPEAPRSSGWRKLLRRVTVPGAALVTVALVLTTGWSILRYRDDTARHSAEQEVAPTAAAAAIAVLSYKPDTVTADLAHARSYLGGDFATYFDKLGNEVVRPAAAQRHMSSTATVTGTSVVSADPDRAVTLVFVDQVTTADDLKQPTTMSSSLRLTLQRVGSHWLVTQLDTV